MSKTEGCATVEYEDILLTWDYPLQFLHMCVHANSAHTLQLQNLQNISGLLLKINEGVCHPPLNRISSDRFFVPAVMGFSGRVLCINFFFFKVTLQRGFKISQQGL